MDSVREKLNLLKKLAIEKKSANYSNKNQHHHHHTTTNEQTELNDHEKVHTTQPTSSSDSNNNNKINSLNGSENKQEKEESNKQHINKLSLINSINNNNNNNNILEGENKIEFILNNKSETESITPVGLLIENKENKQETTTKTKDNTKINDINNNNNSLEIDSADHLNRMKILNNLKTSSLNPPAPAPHMDSRIRSVSIDNSNFKLTGQIIDTDDLIKKASSFKYSKRIQDIYDKERASSNESIHKIGLLQQQHYLLNPNFNNNYLTKQSAPLVVPEVINELTSNNEASDLDQIDNKTTTTTTPNKNKDYSDLSLPNTRLKNNKYVKYLRNTYTSPSITVENSKSRTNSLIRADQSFIRSDRIDRMPSTLTLLNTNGGGSGSNYNSQIDKIKEKFSKISDKTNILSITPAPSHLLLPALLSAAVTTNIIKNNNNNINNKIKANNLNESDNLYSKMNIYNSSNLNSIDDNINNNKNYNISSYNKNINKEILNEKTTLVDSPKTLRKYNKSKTSDLSGLILDLNLNNNNNSNNNYNTNTNTNNETIDITTTTTSASSSTKLDPYQDIYYNNSKNYLNVNNNNNKSKLIKSILKSPSNPNEKSICFDDYVNIIPSSPPTTKQASPIPTIILNNYINETINNNNNNNNFKNRIFVKSPTPAREIPLLEDDFNQENSSNNNNNNENDDFLLNENNLNLKNRNRFNKKKQPATLRSKSVEFSLSLLDLNNNNNNSNNFDLVDNQDMHSVHIDESAMMMHSSRPNLLRQNAFTKSLGENLDTLNNASQQRHHQQQPHSHHHHTHQRQSKSTHNGRHARHSRYYRNKKSNQKSSSFSSTSLSSSSTYSSASSNERYVSKTNNEEINRLVKKNRKISFISSFC
jgi:hypothetical protein